MRLQEINRLSRSHAPRTNAAGLYILQLLAGTVGAWLCATLFGAWLYFFISIPTGWKLPPASQDRLLLALTGIVAIALGYLINKRLRQRAGSWVWVLPLAWLVASIGDELRGMFHDPRAYSLAQPPSLHRALLAIWADYFLGNPLHGLVSEGLGMIATAAFASSAAYSAGAWMAMRSRSGGPTKHGSVAKDI